MARIQLGPEVRRGLVDMNGEGEVVTGIVLLRFGENARSVIERVEERLAELEKSLPEGVEIPVSYDRSQLIERAISTLREKLTQEMLVVAAVCALFLLHLRSAFVAIFTLPVGVLFAFIGMRWLGLNANIMSLGGIAIAIGVMVDASVVMVENLHKHRERDPARSQRDLVVESAREVGPALFFSLVIITVSFVPVFTLEQQEGRLFSPLAYTKTFAMAASAFRNMQRAWAVAPSASPPPSSRPRIPGACRTRKSPPVQYRPSGTVETVISGSFGITPQTCTPRKTAGSAALPW